MYETYYGLNEKPFNVTPDPRFLYLGEHFQEALAHLVYGISQKKGFVVITGEVGTGKTTLIQTLLERLDESVKTALIFNPNLSLTDFFLLVLDEFELKAPTVTKAHFLIVLNNFLLDRAKNNENAVLIIDEAQNLPNSILEEIRLLLNLETSSNKLLQIVLSGQPELNKKLNLPQLRQLKQRISIRYHIPPLNKRDTEEYMKQRLRIAGLKNSSVFTEKAVDEIFKYSKGVPRSINILADNALLSAYADDKRLIDHKIIRECIRDLELKEPPSRKSFIGIPKSLQNPFRIRAWRLSVMLLLLIGIFVGNFFLNQARFNAFFFRLPWTGILINKTDSSEPHHQSTSPLIQPVTKNESSENMLLAEGKVSLPVLPSQEIAMEGTSSISEPLSDKTKPGIHTDDVGKTESPAIGFSDPEMAAQFLAKKEKKESSVKVVTVKRNEWLSDISLKRYGKVNDQILAFIQRANPHIKDTDYIEVGWKIVLPDFNQGSPANDLYSVHIASLREFSDAYTLFSNLAREGYEVYLIPISIPKRGHWYRVSVGKFEGEKAALEYAKGLLASRSFQYAKPMHIAEAAAMDIER
ncbi:MAG: AAA family ATPase [Thermodesulfobacteriota bacterium]|nr:AAA family ATPase [Thermodesulfobacteriota bacterium]